MSENEDSNRSKYKYSSHHVDESSIPSIKKIKSLYENKIEKDQNSISLEKLKAKNKENSRSNVKSYTSKSYNDSSLLSTEETTDKTITSPLMNMIDKDNTDTDNFSFEDNKNKSENIINYSMSSDNYSNNDNSLKRKYDDSQISSEIIEYDSQDIIKREKKSRINDYKEQVINNFDDNSNIEKSFEVYSNGDSDIENIEEIPKNNNYNKEKIGPERKKSKNKEDKFISSSPLPTSMAIDKEESKAFKNNSNTQNIRKKSTSSNSSTKSKKFTFTSSSEMNKNKERSQEEKGKVSLSESSSKNNSNETINSDPTSSTIKISSKADLKTEESSKSDETHTVKKKNSASSILTSPSKLKSFFHKSGSKENEKEKGKENINNNSLGGKVATGTTNDNDVKRVPKRKRHSSEDEGEDDDMEIERQKYKKIRLLEEEIKTIQQSIELKQQELQIQYDNLIKTKNSLSSPTSETLPEFVPMDFNPKSSIYSRNTQASAPPMNRPSLSSNFSNRSNFYDYPPSFMDDMDSSFVPNSDYRRFNNNNINNINNNQNINSNNNPRFSNGNTMNNNGRFSNGYPPSSYNFGGGRDDSSFYSGFNRNPNNRNSNISHNSNMNYDPRLSTDSYNTSYFSKFDPPNLSNNNGNYPPNFQNNSFVSPTSSQPPKKGFFSFLRRRSRRNTQGSDPDYPYDPYDMSNSMDYDQSQNPMNFKRNSIGNSMDVSLTKPFYYYFIPLTRRKVKVRVDPLLRNAINYAKAAGNFECLKYLCEFEKIPNKYIDLRSIEEAAAHNDIDELKFLLKHSWFYDIKRFFIFIFKLLILAFIFILIIYYFNGVKETMIALFVTYVIICITYNWINRD